MPSIAPLKNPLSASLALAILISFALTFFTAGCSVFGRGMSDEEALKSIRDLSVNGKLPPENVVLEIENRFSGSKVGALAKLMRARIRYESGDFTGAASILNSSAFERYTTLSDYSLWLRGKSLQASGAHSEAVSVLKKLMDSFPDSAKANDARLAWASSAIEIGLANDVPATLTDLVVEKNPEALLLSAKAFKLLGVPTEANRLFRQAYFSSFGTEVSKQAAQSLQDAGQPLSPQNPEEIRASAEALTKTGGLEAALDDYVTIISQYPDAVTPDIHLRRLEILVSLRRMPEAAAAFDAIPKTAPERETGFYRLVSGHIKNRNWPQIRILLNEMAASHPKSGLSPKAFVEAGYAARDAKVKSEESYFLREALKRFPDAVEVAGAQFELSWLEHESGNFRTASEMLVQHLARYADRDTTYRGRAGYWAARNAERAGRTDEACVLYDALIFRYSANWYGYLGLERLNNLRADNKCLTLRSFPEDSEISLAARNLKKVTVAPEKSTDRESARTAKASELGSIGLFDWAEGELREAQRTAGNSPKVSLAVARHHRMKGDNTSAFLALAKSYPDYAQMFPEEMSKNEWEIFYPLTNWSEITYWAGQRNLDPYQVAGLIRQESVFNPRAKSSANAFGLMQLLLSTARLVAKKYNSSTTVIFPENLYDPALNIELGTAYMRDQLEKYGRIEYMAAAYNAGPGRVVQWRQSLPLQMDEFVEAIPFRETRMYVQGVIRNTAQYRRLYDEKGNFRPNVGSRPINGSSEQK